MRLTFTYLGITLAFILMFVGCYRSCTPWHETHIKPDTTTKVETKETPIAPSTTNINRPTQVSEKKPELPKKLAPAKNYDSLLVQYEYIDSINTVLYNSLYSQRTYRDTFQNNDTKSFVISHSSVFDNKLAGQYLDWHLFEKTTTVTQTITKYADPVRQVYFNYGVGASFNDNPKVVSNWAMIGVLGFSYKDRKDRLYTANLQANTMQQYGLTLIRSGKISFRRKK